MRSRFLVTLVKSPCYSFKLSPTVSCVILHNKIEYATLFMKLILKRTEDIRLGSKQLLSKILLLMIPLYNVLLIPSENIKSLVLHCRLIYLRIKQKQSQKNTHTSSSLQELFFIITLEILPAWDLWLNVNEGMIRGKVVNIFVISRID